MSLLLYGLLAAVVGLVADDVLHQAESYRLTQATQRAEAAIGHLVRGAQHLAFERGRTNVVLRAPAPIGQDNRAFIDERRRLADQELAAAIHLLDDGNVALSRRLSRQVQVLSELRPRADALMALSYDQREQLFADHWFNALSSILESVPESVFLLADGHSLPPLARVTLYAFDLRNALGVESSRLASALAVGRVPDAAQLQELARLRGQGDSAWANLRREAAVAANPAVGEALARVDMEVYRNFRPLQDAVLHAFANQRLPQQPVSLYTAASVPALDAAAQVMAVATHEGSLDAERAIAQALVTLILHSAVLAVLLGLAVGAVVLSVRLLSDVAALRAYLDALSENRLDLPLPRASAGREMADMVSTAGKLRLSLAERRRLEIELAEMSRQNRLILDNAADGLIGLDGRGFTVFTNPAAQRLTGWTMAELEGRSHHDLIHHSRADGTPNPAETCPVHQTLADGKPRRVGDDLFWRKDGTAFPVEMSVTAWGQGSQRGAVLVFRDISDRKRAEERNIALFAELRRSNADLENFAYAVSHDLQAPLRSVAGFLALTRRGLAGQLDQRTGEFMDFAEQGAQRMAEMIAALLDFARVGTRGKPPHPVSTVQTMAGVLADLAPMIAERHAQVMVSEALPWVLADPAQLNSVLQNLIANALKYCPADRNPVIEVSGHPQGGMARLSVSDNGPGIPEDQREQVFGLFKRGGGHDTVPGLGMGLAICRRIVERLGGSIRVEDGPAGGARFVVVLPLAEAAGVEGTGVTT